MTTVSAVASVNGTVLNDGTLRVARLGTLTLNNGATWTQTGDLIVQSDGNFPATMIVGTRASLTYTGAGTIKVQPPTGNFGGTSRLTISGILTTGSGFEALTDTKET